MGVALGVGGGVALGVGVGVGVGVGADLGAVCVAGFASGGAAPVESPASTGLPASPKRAIETAPKAEDHRRAQSMAASLSELFGHPSSIAPCRAG